MSNGKHSLWAETAGCDVLLPGQVSVLFIELLEISTYVILSSFVFPFSVQLFQSRKGMSNLDPLSICSFLE
jgi:hypothetical protein